MNETASSAHRWFLRISHGKFGERARLNKIVRCEYPHRILTRMSMNWLWAACGVMAPVNLNYTLNRNQHNIEAVGVSIMDATWDEGINVWNFVKIISDTVVGADEWHTSTVDTRRQSTHVDSRHTSTHVDSRHTSTVDTRRQSTHRQSTHVDTHRHTSTVDTRRQSTHVDSRHTSKVDTRRQSTHVDSKRQSA